LLWGRKGPAGLEMKRFSSRRRIAGIESSTGGLQRAVSLSKADTVQVTGLRDTTSVSSIAQRLATIVALRIRFVRIVRVILSEIDLVRARQRLRIAPSSIILPIANQSSQSLPPILRKLSMVSGETKVIVVTTIL
jgi:hypothetical protein